ncbi:protocadherin Fat 2 [Patella vulgata]|uniref:protocadherin Fat 2 n=1 Tax=Patella vulgata TaxID=6465 RepID=UPI0024A9AF19|nr:protocadherin Fat 2 [Patella vulgata]
MGLMNIIHVLLLAIITVHAFEISVVPTSFFIVETQSTDTIVATIGQSTTSTTNSLNCRIGRTTITTSGGQTSTSTFGGSPFLVGTTDSSSNFGFVDNTIVFNVDSPFKLDATRVSRYELFPTCTDPANTANTQTNSASVIVHVFSNAKPSFRRPFDTATVNVALNSSAVVGARVYNATANVINDQPTDVLAFSVRNIDPNVDYFTLNTASGILTNKVDLRTATQSPIELTIDVTDGFNAADRSLTLTVTLINMNQRPDILGLPVTINRDENTQTLSIVDLSVNDEGVPTNLIPVCTVQPTGGNEVFDLVTRPISLKSRGNQFGSTFLDFETTPRYTVSCSVSDGFLQSQNEVLIFNVNNVNEAPVFSENLVNCIMDESQAGVSACNLGFSIRDPEGNRFITRLFQDENSNRFALTANSNNNNQNNNFFTEDDRLTFNVDYDVDQGRMPERVTLFVNVDEFGAISTATVSVDIYCR